MIYYSDQDDPVHALADTGFPTGFPIGGFSIDEVGPEGNNGFTWTPGGNVYNGISDVPDRPR